MIKLYILSIKMVAWIKITRLQNLNCTHIILSVSIAMGFYDYDVTIVIFFHRQRPKNEIMSDLISKFFFRMYRVLPCNKPIMIYSFCNFTHILFTDYKEIWLMCQDKIWVGWRNGVDGLILNFAFWGHIQTWNRNCFPMFWQIKYKAFNEEQSYVHLFNVH